MNIRKIIRESIEKLLENQILIIDGFNFEGQKKDENNNFIWKYSKTKKSDFGNIEDIRSDYIFNIFIAKTPNQNWYYKIFVYWKSKTSNNTNGKGKDFELQFGPFDSLEVLEKNLEEKLKHNTLFSFNNYKDDNKIQLNNEIFINIEKMKDRFEEIKNSDNEYFKDLKELIPHLIGNKEEVQEFINKEYPDEDDKQLLLMLIQKIDKLTNLNKIDSFKSLF